MKEKNITKYVITAQPERHDSLYWSLEGEKVKKQFAAEFYGFNSAKEFAEEKGINLDGVMNYIVVK